MCVDSWVCFFCRINNTVHSIEKKNEETTTTAAATVNIHRNSTFEAINFLSVWLSFSSGRGSQTDKIIVLVKPYTVTVIVSLFSFYVCVCVCARLFSVFEWFINDKIVGFIFIHSSFCFLPSYRIRIRYQMSHTAADLYWEYIAIKYLDIFFFSTKLKWNVVYA